MVDTCSAAQPSNQATAATKTILQVATVEQYAENVLTLTLNHPDGHRLPDWTPGAHLDVLLPNGVSRQYSLCGDRWDPYRYRLGVLLDAHSRGGSHYIHESLRPGDRVGVGGPRNNFALVPSRRYLFIAGGIGITPILPMIQQAEFVDADWSLVYAGRRRATMAFTDEVISYGSRVHLWPVDETGRPDLPALLATADPATKVYCCGPAGLLAATEAACRHWPPYSLHTERFVAQDPQRPARNRTFEVELRRSGLNVTVPPDLSVLDAVQRAGIDTLSSCRQGVCGTCETGVLEGLPDHRDSILADHERDANDCMFVCVSRSRTDRLVLDL